MPPETFQITLAERVYRQSTKSLAMMFLLRQTFRAG